MSDALKQNRFLSSINLGENTLCAATVRLLVKLLQESPAINSLYLDWGVTNDDVKQEIGRLLLPDAREKLWIKTRGVVPDYAKEHFGHHSGKFHVDQKKKKVAKKAYTENDHEEYFGLRQQEMQFRNGGGGG